MGKQSAVQRAASAYRRGGARELARAGGRALARWISPSAAAGQVERKPVARPERPDGRVQAAQSASTPVATTVSYEAALAFFAPRHNQYVQLAETAAPYLTEGGLVLDVGANIGYFTKTLVETTGFTGRVDLFEPMPRLATFAERTASQLAAQCRVHPYGLSDSDSTIELFIDTKGNLGWNTTVEARANDGMIRQEIEVRRFDGLGLDAVPCVVKIDVEGAEYRVLRGMLDSLKAWSPRPVILCEIGWGNRHPHWDEELAVFAELAGLGYATYDLTGEPVDLATLTRTCDVLFLQTDRPS